MARIDTQNRSHLWADTDIAGLLLLRADFTTHEFAPHAHDELVIAVTERGGAEFLSRGVHENAEPGTVLVFNPGEPHSGRMGWSERWQYRAFYVGGTVLTQFADDLEIAPESLPHFLTNKLKDRALCRHLVALHKKAEERGSVLEKQSDLLAALGGLFARHGEPRTTLPMPGDEHIRVSRVMEYLSDNYGQNVTLDMLANMAGMSTFHLIRCFNRAVGLSPHAYLTQVRVHRAREQLAAGVPLSEAAVAVGFYDQSALNRHFKRIFGVTPGQYAHALTA